ncbi:hypothetical protein Tco_1080908 [Tanacetum coccineum]|uniref:Uncharacterized protein n=1 Tax=Tanacetum coccineum TaxID=301880 RepID=A0ABQ5HXZ7_9ASTR
MSSALSAVTYTSVYTDSEPGRDEDEREPIFIQPHDHDYMPEPIYPEYIPLKDDHVFPVEEQPLPPIDSPTAESPGYVAESDPKEDPEEYEDDETEDGPVDYPVDGGDDGDDDDGNSSGEDTDDEDEDKEDEGEEHLASVDFADVVPTIEPISPPEGTKPASISLPPEAEVERLLAMPTPSSSPPISLSPPSAGERLARCTAPSAHSSPPPVPSPLLPSSGCLTQIQALRIAFTQALVDAGISEVGYGIRDTWVDPAEAVPEIAPMTLGEVNTRVTELAELHEHDTHKKGLISSTQRCSGIDSSSGDSTDCGEGGLCFPRGLGSFGRVESAFENYRRRKAQMVEILRVIRDMRREMGDMQAELLALREQWRRARQPG